MAEKKIIEKGPYKGLPPGVLVRQTNDGKGEETKIPKTKHARTGKRH